MASFRCYGNCDVIATLIMTNFHLNTTVVAIFPNACLWRHSLYSNLVLTLKTNCIKPSSYASTAYVVVIRPSFLFWANGLPPPMAKNFPYAYALWNTEENRTAFSSSSNTYFFSRLSKKAFIERGLSLKKPFLARSLNNSFPLQFKSPYTAL